MSKKNEEKSIPEQETPAEETKTAPEASEEPEAPAPEAAEASEVDALRDQLKEQNDKYLRMLAEYDNYRRRSQKERESIYADVRADTVKKLLPVYDNLLRAAAQEPNEDAKRGMDAILTQFKTILSSLGVTEIEAVGRKFDPALHEALLHIDDEKYGEGEIVLELERGFMLGDKVIRFAKVQVAN